MSWRSETAAAAQQLIGHGIAPEEANLQARQLCQEASGWRMTQYLMHLEDEPEEDTLAAFHQMIARRCRREPLQHITGSEQFYGLTFEVGPDVLIPRQDTEVLVDSALSFLKQRELQKKKRCAGPDCDKMNQIRVLDLCTGSGCIAIALADSFPHGHFTATDLSPRALAVAKRNVTGNHVAVDLYQGDLYEALPHPEKESDQRFDLIVSNPPYIETQVIDDLDEEVKHFDPMLALDGGEDGLMVYRPLIAGAPGHLSDGGMLMLEIGYDQGESVSSLMKDAGFEEIEVCRDLAGLDRVVKGSWRDR